VVGGAPALIDFHRSIVTQDALRTDGQPEAAATGSRATDVRQRALDAYNRIYRAVYPSNHQAESNVRRMLELLRAIGRTPVALVIGGATMGSGLTELYQAAGIDILGLDVYSSRFVNLLADAHRIPLADGSVDAVIVQAVLEHVLSPQEVVDEIHRVLRPDGLVYADTPFLMPVHAGPLDFTRFTERGHRYLFRAFTRIDSGTVAGAGSQLWWAIDFFVRALFRSPAAGAIARLAFAWLPRCDAYLDSRHSLDAANAVYFLGRRADSTLDGAELITGYRGAQPASWGFSTNGAA
jgi:SAM-dependent methyltransferase